MNYSNKISGAEAVIRCLLEEGVNLIYGYPGGAIMPIYDELYKYQPHFIYFFTYFNLINNLFEKEVDLSSIFDEKSTRENIKKLYNN